MRRKVVRAPEGGSRPAGGSDHVVLDGGPVAVLHVRDADYGRDEGCGEFRDVVDHNVWRPLLDDGEQVVRAWLQLDPDEELREDEAANVRRRKRGSKTPYPPGERLHRVRGEPDAKRREAFHFGGADDRLARRECHVMSRFGEGACEWQHRSVVTHQRSAGQERTHPTTLAGSPSHPALPLCDTGAAQRPVPLVTGWA